MKLKNVFVMRAGIPCSKCGFVYSPQVLQNAANVYNSRVSNGRSGYGELRSSTTNTQVVLQNELKNPSHVSIDVMRSAVKATNLRVVDDVLVADIEVLGTPNGKTLLDVFSEGVPEYTEMKHPVVRFEIRAIVKAEKVPIVDTCVIIAIDAVY